ncbi:hypothetical protein [Parasedimentitalea denitrificans]|nr:hypothetical protein [Sedimentitalea sp. CY04]
MAVWVQVFAKGAIPSRDNCQMVNKPRDHLPVGVRTDQEMI